MASRCRQRRRSEASARYRCGSRPPNGRAAEVVSVAVRGPEETERPLVSIVIPSYNQGRFLRETLDSVLGQDYRPLEILVVDGASTDETVPILEEYGAVHPEFHWWSEPDAGLADAVNKGLSRSTGVYAGIQSSDDVYRPGAVREAVEILESDADLGLVYGNADAIDEDGNVLFLIPHRRAFTMARFLARSTMIHQSSAFFDLRLAQALGGWNPEYYCGDTEMWLRMAFRTGVRHVDRVWSAWRQHDAQRDKGATAMCEAWGRMVAESLDIARAPVRVRLAAKAGRRVIALDYDPIRVRSFRMKQAWRAVMTYPPIYRDVTAREPLFPRIRSLARAAGRVKRRFVQAGKS